MKKSIQKIQKLKNDKIKITALTAYDYSSAKYLDESDIDIILVGDSVGTVVLGYDNTISVSVDEIDIFVRACSKAVNNALLVADMPFSSFQISKEETTKNAIRFIKSGANAVKIEGCNDYILDCISHLTQNGIPVMGHLGFTPMNINTIGGNKIQGKNYELTLEILQAAKKLEQAGCFSIVLELVPKQSAKFITERISVPTIGIGAGSDCDGQILVLDDLIGKFDRFKPKFARQYMNYKELTINSVKKYIQEVRNNTFPSIDESFLLDETEVNKLENYR